jgi:hypothetical protein
MFRAGFLKFNFLSRHNLARFLLLNLLLLLPLGCFGYSLSVLIPVFMQRVERFSVSIPRVYADQRLTVAVVHAGETGGVYVFDPDVFNEVRGEVFASVREPGARQTVRERSLGFRDSVVYADTFTVRTGEGEPLLDLYVEGGQEQSVEILFLDPSETRGTSGLLPWILLGVSFPLLFGSLGGVADYTQRIVFHETRAFGYFFTAAAEHFFRSLLLSLFLIVVTGAIGVNIYFYIFVISSDFSVFIAALNFWMLVFFIFILFWIFPLLILNNEETVWKIMRKSLFISFDNFDFTLHTLLRLLLLFALSCCTLFIYPGIAGMFSMNNAALKEISGRYTS